MPTIRNIVMSTPVTTSESAALEREFIVDHIRKLECKWSEATIRPSRTAAIAQIIGDIERGVHHEAE